MFDLLMKSIYEVNGVNVPTFPKLMLCLVLAMVYGTAISLLHIRFHRASKGMALALVFIPFAVASIAFLVNSNLGMGVAVLGTFSLVRFRSAQGSASEITALLMATAIGLSCGGGFVFIGALLTVLFCLVLLVLYLTGFAQKSTSRHDLRILLPESLNFTGLFDDLFETYTTSHVLTRVKTTAMGSMYELTYSVTLKQQGQEKAFMDEIRVRNSNLTVTLTSPLRNPEEL